MQRQLLFSALIFLFLVTIFSACVDHELVEFEESNCGVVSYSTQIAPIVVSKCAFTGCHNASASLNWTSYANLSARAHSGVLMTRISNGTMPPNGAPGGPLTADEISLISCWVQSGAPNN